MASVGPLAEVAFSTSWRPRSFLSICELLYSVSHHRSNSWTLRQHPGHTSYVTPCGRWWSFALGNVLAFLGSHWSKWLVCVVCYTGDDGQNVGGHERTVQSSLVQDWEIRQSGDVGGRDASRGDKSGQREPMSDSILDGFS